MPADATDIAVSNAMAGATWVAFAGRADPNAPGLHRRWARYDAASNDGPLAFGDRVAPVGDARAERLDFLDAYFASR